MGEKCKCGCCHVPDYGACDKFEASMDPAMCVYCDHGKDCHSGKGKMLNGPIHPYERTTEATKDAEAIALGKIPPKYA